MLDRKLRIVNEHCTGDEWTRWALLALGSVYGFEWQGDNLLLARESLLASFSESYEQQFGHKADRATLMLAAEIIAWNVWQMDGLKGVVPVSCRETRIMETDFFGETKVTSVSPCPGCEHDDITLHNGMRCCLRRWLPSESMTPNHFDYNYTEIITKKYKTYHKNKYLMKFDFVIGNPPYQEETVGTSDTPVYDRFMDASFVVSKKALLITPARFLFNAGKTPSAWNKKMLNDEHFKVLDYYPVSDKVFSNTDIKGGVAVTYRDETQKLGPIGVFTTYPELNSIYKKVTSNMEQGGLTDLFYMQNKFKLNTLYADYPQYKNIIGSEGKERRLTAAILYQLDVFTEAQEKDEDVAIIGVINNKRVKRYIDRKYLDLEKTNLNKWKVLVPKSNGSGVLGEVLSTPLIAEPTMGYTQTFLGVGAFDNESEAQAAYKYIISKFARTMLGVLKITQDNPPEKWKYVPLQDFTNHSDIDWTKSVHEIDLQLYDKYGLSADERNFIETHVKAMDE